MKLKTKIIIIVLIACLAIGGVVTGIILINNNKKAPVNADPDITPKTYAIIYKDQGGSDFSGIHGDNYPTTHTYNTETNLVNAQKDGYTFLGWFLDENCEGSAVTKLGATDYDNDIVLYAKWKIDECLVEGTKITMADGSKRNIESLSVGDEVKVFDHEQGEISTAKIIDLWQYEELSTNAFTLHFTNDINVNVSGGHCFFEKTANKYVEINFNNAQDYVGKSFFNADDCKFETLIGFEKIDKEVKSFIIVTEKYFNCVAEGMLANEDGIYTILANVFEFGENLKIDSDKMAEDIANYGLWSFENAKYITIEAYDSLNLKYLNIAIGKNMISAEMLEKIGEYSATFDTDLIRDEMKETDLRKNGKLN